jgi:hypothetical protein
MMNDKFTSDVSEEEEGEEDDSGKSEPPATFLSALEGINTLRKYMMPALSSIVNKVYMGQQKVKQQQRTLMDI